MDSILYQNGLLTLLIGSFFVFIVCVFCIGACTDRGICCHEHAEMRQHRLHTRLLFEQSTTMFRQIAESNLNPHLNHSHENNHTFAHGEIGK